MTPVRTLAAAMGFTPELVARIQAQIKRLR